MESWFAKDTKQEMTAVEALNDVCDRLHQ